MIRRIETTLALALTVAALVAPSVARAKPAPGSPLNAIVCKAIGGVWTFNTCTIPPGTNGVAAAGFKVGAGILLDIQGSLTVNRGVTVTVASLGAILVENAGGVPPVDIFHDWETGLLVVGALDNAGTITVRNAYDATNGVGTEGITVTFSVDETPSRDPKPFLIVPATFDNSGTITVENSGSQTRGIKNQGSFTNAASGTINLANTVAGSVGIYNRREYMGQTYYIDGTVTNAGTIHVANSGDASGYGFYNVAALVVTSTGTFDLQPSGVEGDLATGLYNAGSITSHGTFVNDRGAFNWLNPAASTWGSFNAAGSMMNYGTTNATGTFYNGEVMINLGTLTNWGILADGSPAQTMINYGTIYNYGAIGGGVNHGFCIDETWINPDAGGC